MEKSKQPFKVLSPPERTSGDARLPRTHGNEIFGRCIPLQEQEKKLSAQQQEKSLICQCRV